MISVFINGGLGNMMFQIAFIESLAKKHGLKAGYVNLKENIAFMKSKGRLQNTNKLPFDLDLPKATYKRKKKISDTYEEIIPEDGTCYEGWATSEKNFYSESFIWDLFQPSKEVKTRLSEYSELLEGNTCSLHVRRTDYVNNPDYAQLGLDYYRRAIKEIGADKYIVCSDDPGWCLKNLGVLHVKLLLLQDIDTVELFIMSLNKNNIIANSTFSWWSAYLNQNPDKKVICPKDWVGDGRCQTDDIVSQKWIQL